LYFEVGGLYSVIERSDPQSNLEAVSTTSR